MPRHWFRKPIAAIFGLMLLLLILAVACGAAEEPTAVPPSAASAAPTAMAKPTAMPGDSAMAAPKYAPSFASYWQPPTEFYGQPVKGGTLNWIYEDPLEHANAWGASTGSADRMRMITGSLIVETDPWDDGKIIPDLAMGWTAKDDATGITFAFHENITWHGAGNGAPFVCEDARFWLQTMLTGEGLTASAQKGNLSFIDLDGTSCLDDNTLEVGYKGPSAIGLLAFTKADAVVFNKAWFEAGGEDAMFQDLGIGTGPFMWEDGQSVGIDEQRFVKNPNYFKGDGALPYLDGLVLFGILSEATQRAAMLAHEGDWHWVRNFGQYDAYVNHDQINTVIRATRGHHSFWMNRRNAPFDNVRVRQAIIMGMDRGAAIKIIQQGFGSTGFIMPPGSPWSLDEATGCAVPGWCLADDMKAQRAEAKQILEEEGFDFDKTYLFTVESDAQVVERATFMQEQLRLMGIKTEFDLVETVAYRQQTSDGTWGDFLPRNDTMPADDPFSGMNHYFGSGSLTNNHWVQSEPFALQEKADELLLRAATTIDPAQRKAISDELQLLAMKNYWKFPIYWEQEAVAFWPEVRGYFHHPQPSGAHTRWENIWLDRSHEDDKGFKGQTSGVPGGI